MTMPTRARELTSNPRHARPYKPADPTRVRHDTLWAAALERWRPGRRVWIEAR